MKPVNRTLLIEQNRALVGFALAPLLRRWADLSDDDRADVNAAGLRALVKAADNYDPDAGVKFSTYAVTLIQFAGRKALATRGEWKARRAGIALASLDAPIEAGDGTTARAAIWLPTTGPPIRLPSCSMLPMKLTGRRPCGHGFGRA